MDLSTYVSGNRNDVNALVYDLFAVNNHVGETKLEGHYTTFGMNAITNEWLFYDDAEVVPASTVDIVSDQAYMLFYNRRGVHSNLHFEIDTAENVGSIEMREADENEQVAFAHETTPTINADNWFLHADDFMEDEDYESEDNQSIDS